MRVDEILKEFNTQAETLGVSAAVRELAGALAAEEARHDELKRKILGMVEITDRRGIFLPPAVQRIIP